jgi:hypothetical protein
VTPDVRRFLDEMRLQPEYRAAAARDPRVAADFAGMEAGLDAMYAAGTEDARSIDLWDDLQRVVVRDDWTIRERLLAIEALLIAARLRRQ